MSRLFLLAALIVLPITIAISKAPTVISSGLENRYIIVLKDQPVLQYQKELSGGKTIHSQQFQAKGAAVLDYANRIAVKQQALEQSILQMDSSAQIENRMAHVINAIVVTSNTNLQSQLQSMPDVKYAVPVTRVKPSLTRSHTLMKVEPAWEQLGGRDNGGEGIFIAVIDTGIDITHPVFNDTGYVMPEGFPKGLTEFTNNKIIAARIFPPNNTPRSERTPEDREGHGSDVASIAAASVVTSPLGVLSGVAPKAYIGNYKIFFNDGASSDQVIAAINQAVLDGAHVINMSLGSEQYADPQHDPQLEAVQNAIDLGVTCVIAAGNEGRPLMIGNPQQVEDAITVNASSNSHNGNTNQANVLLLSAVTDDGITLLNDAPANFGYGVLFLDEPHIGAFTIQDIDLYDGGGFGGELDGRLCEDLPNDVHVDGWILVQRGECNFSDKVNRAQSAGAKGVIFYDNVDQSLDFPSVEGALLPSMMITQANGLIIKNALAEGKQVSISINTQERETTPNKVTTFSNIGPAVDYIIKPDITAIGSGSYGATQNDFSSSGEKTVNAFSGFAWFDGTSMATPRVSGIAALIKQKHPDWSPSWVKSAIVLSAQKSLTDAFNNNPAEVTSQGGGLANADAALQVETLVIPPIIGFGAQSITENSSITKWIQIVNTSGGENSYTLSHVEVSNKPVIVSSQPQFILKPGEKIDIALTMQFNTNVAAQDHEIILFLNNLNTGEIQKINTWVRVNQETIPSGSILLVDDDDGNTFDTFYAQLLIKLGKSFNQWDVKIRSQYPNISYMQKFKTIVWIMGEKSLNTLGDETSRTYLEEFNSRHLFETAMAQYVSGGGSLFLSGQDFLDDKESAMISREVLHSFFNDTAFTFPTVDRDTGASQIQGVAGNPVFDGLGPFTLNYPPDFEDLSDRIFSNDNTIAKPALFANDTPNRTVAMTVDACAYRAVFLAFPLEAMNDSDAEIVLSRSLNWMDEGVLQTEPKVISVTPNEIIMDENSSPVSIEINGSGFALENGNRAYLDTASLMNEERKSCNVLTATIPAGMQPGEYTLKVVTGAGNQLFLPNAVKIMSQPPVAVSNWHEMD